MKEQKRLDEEFIRGPRCGLSFNSEEEMQWQGSVKGLESEEVWFLYSK